MENKQKEQLNRMTTEPVEKLLLKLSIPTIISMMVTNIYNIVDTAFVGTLGTSESGATGIVFGFMAILQAFAFLCGQGAGSIMSRSLGAKKYDEATQYTSIGFFLSFLFGLILGILGFVFMNPLLWILGSTETIAPHAKTYLSFILLVAPLFTSSYTMNNLLRYEGKAKLGTIGMMTGAFLNIGLDALLMMVFNLGIMGAGIATAVSQTISFIILISMYLRGRTQTKIAFRFLAKSVSPYLNVITTGFPSLIRQTLNSVATMALNKCAGVYGDAAVSAMSVVSRISFFPMAISIGIGQGFQPISGYNYGANRKDRVRKAFWSACVASELVAVILAVPIYFSAPNLVQLLRDDPEVIMIGKRALQLMCFGQMFVPLTMMVEMGFQSIGMKLLASISSCLRSGIVFIPVLLVMSRIRGLSGIQEAQPLAFALTFGISVFLMRTYLKKLKE